jgi:hypothetical protein
MRYLTIGFLILLSSCQQLMKGQEQPVIYKSTKEKIMFTTCSGTVEYWGTCFEKAKNTCPNGYVILEKNENPTSGSRDLTFQCNK